MTYLDTEKSQHGGKPNELYKFEGTYANFFYTSGPKKIVFDGDTYLPIAIKRSEISVGTQEDDGLDVTVELAVTNEIVQVYGFQDSPPSLNLQILRFHTLADVVTYWDGPVNDIQVSNGVATIRSPSTLGAALDANIPNVFFQSPCNHVLYDERCKVDYADWSEAATVTAVAGRVVTVNSVGTLDAKLIGGEVLLASGERRMITAQNAGEIIVNFPFSQLHVADIVMLAAGCDLAYKGDCKTKFDNNRNFGGFPFIPAANPFADGIDASIVPLPDNTCLPDEGAYLTVTFSIVGPECNAGWTGDRYMTIHAVKPNGPNGREISTIHFQAYAGGADHRVEYEDNNPGLDYRLRGQKLAEFTATNFNHWEWKFYFPCVYQNVNVFPSASYCGSVGRDDSQANVTWTYAGGGGGSLTQPLAGLYNQNWPG